ncbi:DUF2336 domain-containing protein [Rhizobiales bacterium RZME27]|uniref:DUF2336 domain-containing protein n=1 Tax=Endobacterium cereale TaxID=2663029 RepID=A0A6A8A5S2_9HYPH|nr:DUF2336 domain-containing protein [Endobacterium cereale]MEB2843500.1 DUF2336 domain-containing protein [Endobacterium cereale]MQY44616.1 DUF2336 domain-containing protein [Endobacterium cereale]
MRVTLLLYWGFGVIVQAFLRWAETARPADRAKAAHALARGYLASSVQDEKRQAAVLALTHLLDDPSPVVRTALAEAVADSPDAPRGMIMSLAEDQPLIASSVITRSPVLTDIDLVDLVGRGSVVTRALVASRPNLSRGISAAIAEVAGKEEALLLLENETASITRFTLRRIAERHGHNADIRNVLLDREDLAADARHLLVSHVSEALAASDLMRTTLTASRIDYVTREASEAATVAIAGTVRHHDIAGLVEHLRQKGRLTPAFLIHVLCGGKVDFFSGAICNLSGLDDQRVRSILATGRMHAVRALFEAAGLDRSIANVFVEAVLLWREAARSPIGFSLQSICLPLIERFRAEAQPMSPLAEMLDMIEKLHLMEERLLARSYAGDLAFAA